MVRAPSGQPFTWCPRRDALWWESALHLLIFDEVGEHAHGHVRSVVHADDLLGDNAALVALDANQDDVRRIASGHQP